MRFYILALKRWFEYRLRYWRNRKVLRRHSDAIAKRFAKFGIDVKSDTIEESMNLLEGCEAQYEAARQMGDLFAAPSESHRPDPFGRFNDRHKQVDLSGLVEETESVTSSR